MTGQKLTIRAARHEDVEACFALYREVQEMHAAQRPDLFKQPELDDNFRRLVAGAIDADHKGILLAWHDTQAVGMVIYEFTRLDPTGVYLIDRPILWLESVAVAAAYRGKGCGKAMMDLVRRHRRRTRRRGPGARGVAVQRCRPRLVRTPGLFDP